MRPCSECARPTKSGKAIAMIDGDHSGQLVIPICRACFDAQQVDPARMDPEWSEAELPEGTA